MTGAEIALGFTLFSGAMSALGTLQQGMAASAAADYNAQVSRRNAAIARQQADAEAADKRNQANRALHSIRAAYGASGLDISGSPLDVLMDSATELELGVAKEKYKGELRALEQTDKANLYEAQSDSARLGSYLGAGAQITRTLGQAFGPGNGLFFKG